MRPFRRFIGLGFYKMKLFLATTALISSAFVSSATYVNAVPLEFVATGVFFDDFGFVNSPLSVGDRFTYTVTADTDAPVLDESFVVESTSVYRAQTAVLNFDGIGLEYLVANPSIVVFDDLASDDGVFDGAIVGTFTGIGLELGYLVQYDSATFSDNTLVGAVDAIETKPEILLEALFGAFEGDSVFGECPVDECILVGEIDSSVLTVGDPAIVVDPVSPTPVPVPFGGALLLGALLGLLPFAGKSKAT